MADATKWDYSNPGAPRQFKYVFTALIDTGASIMALTKKTVDSMQLQPLPIPDHIHLSTWRGPHETDEIYLLSILFPNRAETCVRCPALKYFDEDCIDFDIVIGNDILAQCDIFLQSCPEPTAFIRMPGNGKIINPDDPETFDIGDFTKKDMTPKYYFSSLSQAGYTTAKD